MTTTTFAVRAAFGWNYFDRGRRQQHRLTFFSCHTSHHLMIAKFITFIINLKVFLRFVVWKSLLQNLIQYLKLVCRYVSSQFLTLTVLKYAHPRNSRCTNESTFNRDYPPFFNHVINHGTIHISPGHVRWIVFYPFFG